MDPWFDDIVNFMVTGEIPKGWNKDDGVCFLSMIRSFIWDYLFKY